MSGDIDFETNELEEFIQKYIGLDRGVQQPKGIFSILSSPREKQYQYTLKYFLNPRKSHGFGYTLLETFLNCIDFRKFNLSGQHIEIEDEVWIADDGLEGRIDLVICGGNALTDHPRWAVFLELKVGAEEGDRQTATYAEADEWDLSWFDTSELTVDCLDDKKYVYLKRAVADGPTDRTEVSADDPIDDDREFEVFDWFDLVGSFEAEIQDSLFEYPNRSVIQLTDFIRSLKETEGMSSEIDEDVLNERLNLYFEHDSLIQQIKEANSQFESDFEDLSTHLENNWESEIDERYNFEDSGWKTSLSSSTKFQGILPEYWNQDPLDGSSTIKLYYRHSPTVESLRNQRHTFALRLPPQRKAHREEQQNGQSFNDVFTEKCTTEYEEEIHDSLESIDVDECRMESASALIVKNYPLDSDNLMVSYFDQLEKAVDEFCCAENGLPKTINEVFRETYEEVFNEKPEGDFSGYLPKRK